MLITVASVSEGGRGGVTRAMHAAQKLKLSFLFLHNEHGSANTCKDLNAVHCKHGKKIKSVHLIPPWIMLQLSEWLIRGVLLEEIGKAQEAGITVRLTLLPCSSGVS